MIVYVNIKQIMVAFMWHLLYLPKCDQNVALDFEKSDYEV